MAALTAAAIAAHLFKPSDWPHLGLKILHSLHGPGFAVLAVLILWYLQRQCRSNINYVLAAGIAMGIGLLAEIAQIPGPRNAEKIDIVTDALGVFGAIGLIASFDRQVRRQVARWIRVMLPFAASIGLFIAIAPTVWYAYALLEQRQAFPSLLSFEYRWEKSTFDQSGNLGYGINPAPAEWPGPGVRLLRGDDYGRRGHFLNMRPLPDWTGYNRFVFVAASAGEPFDLDIDIRDRRDVPSGEYLAFATSVHVGPVAKEYSISFSEISAHTEDFDFSQVMNIVFSAGRPDSGHVVLLDQIRLEK